MKSEDFAAGISLTIPSPPPPSRKEVSGGKIGYKFWVLAALLLLAFWSLFTGSVSLKWSSNNLTKFSSADHADFSPIEDLDILELDQREKAVRRMWDVYTQRANAPLTRFWLEAFEAAYEFLSSDVPGVKDAAVSEIAKLSMYSDHLSVHSTGES